MTICCLSNINLPKIKTGLEFAPDHFVDDANVGLDDFYYFGAYVFVYVVGDWDSVLAVAAEFYGCINCLEERLFVDTGDDKVALVNSLRTLCGGANADGWEWVAHTGEEAAFFRKCAAIAHHSKGVHLKTVVVVETEWLVLNHAFIEFEARGCKAVAAAWVAAVEDWHVVLFCHLVDCREQ